MMVMECRPLGRTDINVSLITLGTMTFGEQNTQEQAFEQMDYAVAQGVNTIDVAEIYPVPPQESTYGASETMVGNWLTARACRQDIVLATKVTGNCVNNPGFDYIRGGPRPEAKQIKQAIDGSLTRLQTDYIDLYQIHWPDRKTNCFGRLGYDGDMHQEQVVTIEETILAMGDLIKAGKIRHYGLSNETPWGVMEACRVASAANIPAPVSIQNPYNLLNRTYEIGLSEISLREQIGLLAYSPLAFGTLSGKYLDGQRPAGARLTLYDRFNRYLNANSEAAINAYMNLAKEYQVDPVAMAIAFVNQQQFVSSTIIGATTMEQLKNNFHSLSLTLDKELLKGIAAIHQQYCNPAP